MGAKLWHFHMKLEYQDVWQCPQQWHAVWGLPSFAHMHKAKGGLLIIYRKSGFDINLFPRIALAILLSHCKLSDGDREVWGPGLVCYLCVWPGPSCISTPAWRVPTTPPSLLSGFPGLCVGADANFLHRKAQTWLDLDLVGERLQGAKHWMLPMALSEKHFMQVPSVSLFNVRI